MSTGHHRPRAAVTLGYGAMGAGVGLLVGGSWRVALIAAGASMLVDLLQRAMSRRHLPGFYQQVAGGLLATLIAIAAAWAQVGVSPSLVVTAGIIMLLAGVNFMGAIQDAFTGYPLTAGARMLEALLATAGVIAGVSGGLNVARVAGVELGRLDPARRACPTYP